jgi:hypothetical protein
MSIRELAQSLLNIIRVPPVLVCKCDYARSRGQFFAEIQMESKRIRQSKLNLAANDYLYLNIYNVLCADWV